MIGKEISHYRILEKLGEGGMGVVYKAHDTQLDRDVALKFLTIHLTTNETEKKRFLQEARAAARLNHPNICTVFEIDEVDGQPFIAMELVEGQTLKEKIKAEPLEVKEAIDIAIQIAEGLSEAHEKGIIHRDIKSSNMQVSNKGNVKIMDFGLAKLTGKKGLTKTHSTIGTFTYMSPEQARGEEVDQRSDIWSLGVVLYEMSSSHLPFEGEYEQAVMYTILNEQPKPISELQTDIPKELDRIVNKALAKRLDERYQCMDELITDLKKLKRTLVSGKKTDSVPFSPIKQETGLKPPWHKIMLFILVGLAIILLILVLQWISRRAGTPQVATKGKSIAVLPLTTITQSSEDEIFSNGIHDDIITQLVKIHDLKVIARTSVMQYKNSQKGIRKIGEELNVATILEGSVRRVENKVRIIAQLINTESEEHLWAETYDCNLTDVFAIQSDVAQKIALALKATLTSEEKQEINKIPTDNMLAWEYYQRGNHYWKNYDTIEGNEEAIRMYKAAVQRDPYFAMVWARLTMVHSILATWSETDIALKEKHLPEAKLALDKAVALDQDNPLVHHARGSYLRDIKRDYQRALSEYELALQKQPNNDELLLNIGILLLIQRMMEKSIEYFKKQYELNPNDINSGLWVSLVYKYLRNWPEGEKWATKYIVTRPEHGYGYTRRAEILLWGYGDLEKAGLAIEEGMQYTKNHDTIQLIHNELKLHYLLYLRSYQKTKEFLESDSKIPHKSIWKGFIYTLLGENSQAKANYDSARVLYEKLIKTNPEIATYHSYLGLAYAGLGYKGEAIKEGKRAVDLKPIANDVDFQGEQFLLQLAYISIMVGEYDQAINELETLLTIPSQLTVWRLKLDPRYDPLRNLPRFQQLLNHNSRRNE
jgi:serine/threonine protein kinase/tetratricopeptide (TPR) repeat protein